MSRNRHGHNEATKMKRTPPQDIAPQAPAASLAKQEPVPTATSNRELQQHLQVLREAYLTRLPEKIARLEELCESVLARLSDLQAQLPEAQAALARAEVESELSRARRLAHNLAGSGATYGFPTLSAAARSLEQNFKALRRANEALRAGEIPASDAERMQLSETFQTLKCVAASKTDNALDKTVAPRFPKSTPASHRPQDQ